MKLRYPILRTLAFLLWIQAGDSVVTRAEQPSSRPTLPDNVEKRDVTIFSDGVRMAGRGLKRGHH